MRTIDNERRPHLLKDALPFWSRLSDAQQRELSEGAIGISSFPDPQCTVTARNARSFLVKSGRVRAFILSDTVKR